MKRPTIGVVMPLGYQQGGAENLLLHWLRQGSEKYTLACAFLQDGPMVEVARSLGVKTEVIPATRLTDAANYVRVLFKLRGWVRKERLAGLLSWMPKGHLYAAPACFGIGVPLLWFQHGIPGDDRLNRLISRLPAKAVLCCSEASRAAQRRISPVDRTVVCYPGVPFILDPPTRKESRAVLGIRPEVRLVGMVARWERWKGVLVFLEAAQGCARAFPDAVFFVAGGEHPRDLAFAAKVRAFAEQANLGDRLLLLGQIPPERVRLWLGAADLMVHPPTGPEPFGMVVVEAMGSGRVVVASKNAGPAEIIQDGINGVLAPVGDSPAFASAIIRLLNSPAQLSEMSNAAYERGRSFSVDRFSERLDEVIGNTLASKESR
ncbi:glycosyltransferase family 4 protein [Silvibacterium sp.]|uniref:glycosyltransferase family 4 protein n=1 Tax=Silvibacterium sp. TaxID=1964179 RepID=UPI0039E33590